jgi:FkbM family methyltransferase
MKFSNLLGKVKKSFHLRYKLLSWRLNRLFRKSAIVSTKQGKFKIFFLESESIGRSLYCNGQYENELINDVMKFLRTTLPNFPLKGSGTIIDIGANNGVISIGLLHTGEFAQAIAIEPEPQNFSLLEYNVNLNGLKDKFTCLPYAVADKKGEISFELSDTNFGDHRVRVSSTIEKQERQNESARQVIVVKSDQLDNLLKMAPESFLNQTSLIWMDVQGYEGYVFKGGRDILSKGIPVVSEIWPYGIARAGMTRQEFCEIAATIWSSYWVRRRNKFIKYPISVLDTLFEELGGDGQYENVIFIK